MNKGKTVTKDNVGHLRIYQSSKYLGRTQYKPHRLIDVANEITDELITGPPGHASERAPQADQASRPLANTREVFVVRGRNDKARDVLFDFLRAIDLRPLELTDAVPTVGKTLPYIGELLDAAFTRANAVVVLFTPDDEARLREPHRSASDPDVEAELSGQARPNVLFEAGMAMGLGKERTVLVELGKLRPFTDIAGLHVIRLVDSPASRQKLAQRLELAGCPVDLKGQDWLRAGDIADALASMDQGSPETEPLVEPQSAAVVTPHLSGEAKELLIEATKEQSRGIVKSWSMRGCSIHTNDKEFVEIGNRRSEARWEQALRDLIEHGFVIDPIGMDQSFKVTNNGFEISDSLTK